MNKEKSNKPIKKRIFWILLIVLIVVVSVLVVKLSVIAILHHNSIWMLCAEYEQYANDFNLVKDYISDEFPNEENKCVFESFTYKTIRLYDLDTDEYLTLPDDIQASLYSLSKNAFPNKDSDFEFIRINGERVAFCIANGNYALVYSPDEKPTWLHSPNEKISIRVREIKDGWYHVVKYN